MAGLILGVLRQVFAWSLPVLGPLLAAALPWSTALAAVIPWRTLLWLGLAVLLGTAVWKYSSSGEQTVLLSRVAAERYAAEVRRLRAREQELLGAVEKRDSDLAAREEAYAALDADLKKLTEQMEALREKTANGDDRVCVGPDDEWLRAKQNPGLDVASGRDSSGSRRK